MPTTDEVEAIKTELEVDLKEAVQGLRSDLRDLKGGLKGLVTARECAARHEAEAAHREQLQAQITLTEGRIVEAVQVMRVEVGSMLNGKLEERVHEVTAAVVRDPALQSKMEDVTERHELRKLRQKPPTGAFKKVGEGAKSLAAIIALAVTLIGGCVTGSYYIAGVMNLLRKAAEEAKQTSARQEKLMAKQQGAIE